MANLFLAAEIVLPLILVMATGLLLRKMNVLDENAAVRMNRVVFYVGIPSLCFKSLYEADLSELSDTRVLLFMAAGVALSFLLCMLFVPVFSKDNRRRGVLVQGIFRTNDAVFGIPIASALLGEGRLALMSLTVSMTVTLYNTLGVIALETFRGEGANFKRVIGKLVRHPIIWGCVLGLAANLLGVKLPSVVFGAVKSFAGMSTPMAFLALGATLSFHNMHENRVPLWTAAALKLVAMPVLLVGAAILLGFRGEPLVIALAIFGAPTALATFPMAEAAGADAELAGEIVALTAALSMGTMFLWIFLLLEMGVI